MTEITRPNPDELLAAIKSAETKQKKGKLRLFFGMAAGAGKTYEMLKAAHEQLKAGVDVVVGFVETHGRAETAALLEGLPILPRKKIEYRGTVLEEMDLEAVLTRKPALVLVDELAHTNVPGSRHLKRYQDLMDILYAGIDVYSTMNVQHLESRVDMVGAYHRGECPRNGPRLSLGSRRPDRTGRYHPPRTPQTIQGGKDLPQGAGG
jgi:two-component system sensor histidine kinase KdpD